MKYSELKRFLKRNGCYFLREGGSHEFWYSEISAAEFIIPRHGGQEVPPGTLNSILKHAGIK
ncbi:MAG: type II toxin-antitoxin system HicA family toxin [Synergistaceae bacterium]|nr:type II toxin-antitoxin system HicA family toxin [Synergistaceae bacterium]MBR1602282.1 type II toxin-antitoxin system HicA family toxin [Synergistaceae bacterium]